MTVQVHITCDDAGLSAGIDQAILALHQQGYASSASMMPNIPNIAETVNSLTAIPTLELGAHLNLTEGQPLTEAIHETTLVNADGQFTGRFAVFTTGLKLSSEVKEAIFTELDAQMQRLTNTGIQLEHITTHHQFHILSNYRKLIQDLAQKYQVKWIRNYYLKQAIIPYNVLRKVTQHKCTSTITMPDYLVLVQAWVAQSPQKLLDVLLELNGLIEIILHPCLPVDNTFPSGMMYSAHDRAKEVTFIKEWFTLAQPYIGHQISMV